MTRRAGLSAFGFGGTNFHAVLEEYIPHKLNGNGKRTVAIGAITNSAGPMNAGIASVSINAPVATAPATAQLPYKTPLRGALVIGAATESALIERLRVVLKAAESWQSTRSDCALGSGPTCDRTPGDRLR